MSEATSTERDCDPQLIDPSSAVAELMELERQLESLQSGGEILSTEPEVDRIGLVGRSLLKAAADSAAGILSSNDGPESKQVVRAPTSTENRRALPRRVGKCRVTVACTENIIPSGAPEWEWKLATSDIRATLHDVSLKSIAFDLDVEIPAGRFVLLRITNQDTGFVIDAFGETVRVSPQSNSGFRTVCRLQTPLAIEEISNLGWTPLSADFV